MISFTFDSMSDITNWYNWLVGDGLASGLSIGNNEIIFYHLSLFRFVVRQAVCLFWIISGAFFFINIFNNLPLEMFH